MGFMDKFFGGAPGSGNGSSASSSEKQPLVQKEITERKLDVTEYKTEKGEPMYFALMTDEETLVADTHAIGEAKNKLAELYNEFPHEVEALQGKPAAQVKEQLEALAHHHEMAA